ncbi:Endothelin-converting enzyme 1 [Hondaea fermentalgiana]|uniref:Endothelin-converting enzyme 1 n=1 Tax=Hondaea fermentalgiana TaxID=2315210 RepID=A0A2R5GKP1_9STRA|nr:Endothelin-converting enzyme 1 [Hondaea fermentalgiana]|eukprot:GBG31447.1 Endothelin-converting enzyme 1 [Hondaea fermentalgiana]
MELARVDPAGRGDLEENAASAAAREGHFLNGVNHNDDDQGTNEPLGSGLGRGRGRRHGIHDNVGNGDGGGDDDDDDDDDGGSHWDAQRSFFADTNSGPEVYARGPAGADDSAACGAGHTWARLSPLEKALTLGCAILILALMSVGLRTDRLEELQLQQATICETPACVEAASDLLRSIDASVDPCDDFYNHVCGEWIANHPLEPSDTRVSTLTLVSDRNLQALRQILDPADDASDTSNDKQQKQHKQLLRKPREFFAACMDMDRINAAGAAPLDRAANSFGLHSWNFDPNNATWTASHWSTLRNILAAMHRSSVGALLDFGIGAAVHNSTQNVVYAVQGNLALPGRSSYLGKDVDTDPSLIALQDLVVAQLTAWRGPDAMSAARARDLVRLEQKLATIMDPPERLRDPSLSNTELSLSEFDALMPLLGLARYIKTALDGADAKALRALQSVTVESPSFLEKLQNLLADTKLVTVRDYLYFRIVYHYSPHLSEHFLRNDEAFDKTVFGVESPTPRWKRCVARARSNMGFLVARLFLDEHFTQESRTEASALVENIQASFKSNLDLLDWMDETTRTRARAKVDASRFRIGYPDFVMDDEALQQRYATLEISVTDYFSNLLSADALGLARVLDRLGEPVDKTEWHMNPVEVNAYYSNANNELVFPAGILQPPLFHKDHVPALNYGCIASVIGHELSHGFDDVGAKYNARGNLQTWWEPATYKSFQKRTDCVRQQYEHFKVLGGAAHVRGNLTLGENLADNAGLKQAYTAYHAARQRAESSDNLGTFFKRLPGLETYTSDQLFFVAFARTWCSKTRDQALEKVVLNDVHAPARFRVIGTLQNFRPFASAFKCPSGSPMNAGTRCEVW